MNIGTIPRAATDADKPVRTVFDCNIFLQASISDKGPSSVCLDLAESDEIQLYVSEDLVRELMDVLMRRSTRDKFPVITDSYIRLFLKKIYRISTQVINVPVAMLVERDPKDSPYINLAIAAKADYLVTRDRHLLSLMDSDHPQKSELEFWSPHLTILNPSAFLSVVRER